MDNVVIGQYIPGNSIIHKLDARMKIVLLVILIVALFVAHSIMVEAILLVFTIFLILLSRVSLKKVLGGIKAVLFLLLFTTILQLGNITTGELVLEPTPMHFTLYNALIDVGLLVLYSFTKKYIPFRFTYFLLLLALALGLQYHFVEIPNINVLNFDLVYKIRIYDDGLIKAGFIILRVINLVLLSSLLTFTTSSMDLKNAIESLLKPLRVIKVPVGEIAMMISLVLRFIPTLLEETNKIMKAQASRGVDFAESNLKQKISQITSLLVPMFVISFKRADDLANAMESRGYVIGEKRTNIDVLELKARDFVSLGLICLLLAAVIVSAIFKYDIWSVIA